MSAATATRAWKRPALISNPRWRWAIWIGAGVYLAFAFGTLEINWGRLPRASPRAAVPRVLFPAGFRLALRIPSSTAFWKACG